MTAFLALIDSRACFDRDRDKLMRRACSKLAYRGPHGSSEVTVDGAFLCAANRRIRQRDSCLTQPIVSADSRVVLVFDGRLDEPEALGRVLGIRDKLRLPSDAELVLRAYLHFGDRFSARLEGEFSFVLYDTSEKLMIAGRDIFGSRMLYWAPTNAGLYLSNELPAIRSIADVDDSLDPLGVADYLMHGYVDHLDKVRTPFKGIHAVEPGTRLVVVDGVLRTDRFRRFADVLRPIHYSRPAEIPEAFKSAMSAAVADRLDADRALILLSGGLDSPTIAAAVVETVRSGGVRAELTFCTGLDSAEDEEATYAASVAQYLGVRQEFFFTEPDSLLARPRPLWYPSTQFFVNRREQTLERLCHESDVAIHGLAADSILQAENTSILGLLRGFGARHALHAWATSKSQGRSLSLGTGILRQRSDGKRNGSINHSNGLLPRWLHPQFVEDFKLKDRFAAAMEWQPEQEMHSVCPRSHYLLQWANWFFGFHPADTTDTPAEWTDPFLDHRVLSVLFSMPPEPWRYRKHILRVAGRGVLPEDVLVRPKTSRNHIARWIKGLDRTLVDGWQLSPELNYFVDREAIPSIDMEKDGTAAFVNFRPMMLQRWYSRLGDW